MVLPADAVGFAQPSEDFVVQFLARSEAERMDMIPTGNRLNLGEAGMFEATGEHDVSDEAIGAAGSLLQSSYGLGRRCAFSRTRFVPDHNSYPAPRTYGTEPRPAASFQRGGPAAYIANRTEPGPISCSSVQKRKMRGKSGLRSFDFFCLPPSKVSSSSHCSPLPRLTIRCCCK